MKKKKRALVSTVTSSLHKQLDAVVDVDNMAAVGCLMLGTAEGS